MARQIPSALRKQVEEYQKNGFTIKELRPGRGSHFVVRFDQFDKPQTLTIHANDPRAIRNNIALFNRLSRACLEPA